jgi:hypothetical protein
MGTNKDYAVSWFFGTNNDLTVFYGLGFLSLPFNTPPASDKRFRRHPFPPALHGLPSSLFPSLLKGNGHSAPNI